MQHLSPAYFALVMATGIVSIGAWEYQLTILALALFAFNLAAFAILVGLTVLRAIRYPRALVADLTDHQVGPGFFTAVAGCCILGTQFLLLTHSVATATVLLALGTAAWIVLTYTIFTALTVKRAKPPLEKGVSGAWLIAVVATQSIAVLLSLLTREWPQPFRLELNFFALSMWLWGGMFYIWIISLIFYRYTFLGFSPGDLTPPYWINMGAMGISTLAGVQLAQNAPDAPFLASLLPFLKGFTILHWVTGTWWIPLLLALTIWQYLIQRFPLRYDPSSWGAVFPLGMYTVATRDMAAALDLPFLNSFLPVVFGVALLAWALACVGLIRDICKHLRPGWFSQSRQR